MADLIFRNESYAIVGAAMEVYNELGNGFLESVYQEAMEIELGLRGIPFSSQQELFIFYKGRRLKKHFMPDLLCYNGIIVDLKAIERLTSGDIAQMQNYLNGMKFELGLLINFGARSNLEYKRVVLTESRLRKPENTPT